jgi:hypothetical protein
VIESVEHRLKISLQIHVGPLSFNVLIGSLLEIIEGSLRRAANDVVLLSNLDYPLVVKRILLFPFFMMIIGCSSAPAPLNTNCEGKDKACPLGTQKECTQRESPCKCHCHKMNSDPYQPKQMDDPSIGFPKEEKPSNHELQGPFEGD